MYHQDPGRLSISCMAGNSRVNPSGLQSQNPHPSFHLQISLIQLGMLPLSISMVSVMVVPI